ncbi:MAG: VWA domain-containing protein [Sphingobacteriales bacterium]|nr:VWA domain-containing protein [Sphingobacteriales bacterium]
MLGGIILWLNTCQIQAQNSKIEGSVYDAHTHLPLTASIAISSMPYLIFSDKEGAYSYVLPTGKYVFGIYAPNYEPFVSDTLHLYEEATLLHNFFLQPVSSNREEVFEMTEEKGNRAVEIKAVTREDLEAMPTRMVESIASKTLGTYDAAAHKGTPYDRRINEVVKNEPTTASPPPSLRKVKDEPTSAASPTSPLLRQDAADTNLQGKLTAGEVNDFGKWELWKDLTEGELAQFQQIWHCLPTQRFTVQVSNSEGWALSDVPVELLDENKVVLWSSRSDNTGKAELWANLFLDHATQNPDKLQVRVGKGKNEKILKKIKPFQQGINMVELPKADCHAADSLDIVIVLDVTGSMGDELRYLQKELSEVTAQIKSRQNDLYIRTGIVLYQDEGDLFVTKYSDLNENIDVSTDFLQKTRFGGGGDTPEALDVALETAVEKLSWSEAARARLAFVITDAPAHQDAATLQRLHNALAAAAHKGIRIVPMACSGIDKSGEYLLRSMALACNGTYTFLTDDSGIGNAHIKPSTDHYEVETATDLLVRVIQQYSSAPACDTPPPPQKSQPEAVTIAVPVMNKTAADSLSQQETEQPSLLLLSCYPNPTYGALTITTTSGSVGGMLYVADMNGKLLARYDMSEQTTIDIDLSPFPAGIYLISYIHPETEKAHSAKISLLR